MFIQTRYTVGLLLLLFVSMVLAEVVVPNLSRRVTDLTATLNAGQITALETKLADFETKKGSQIAVLILPSTQSETIEAFSIRVAEAWKIGRKNIDDGVILIVAKEDRKLRLEVGRGLEGAIPDAIAKRVLAETIKPYFKANDYAGGIDAGVTQLMSLIEGEKLPEVQASYEKITAVAGFFILFSLIAAFFFIGDSNRENSKSQCDHKGQTRRQRRNNKRLLSNNANSSGSFWSSSSDNTGSSSDFSGGGGDFGGGGASDSW